MAAAAAADQGATSTAQMPAAGRVGRASRLAQRSIGTVDPGARSFAIVLAALAGVRCASRDDGGLNQVAPRGTPPERRVPWDHISRLASSCLTSNEPWEGLSLGLGIEWSEPQERQNGPYHLRISFSRRAPYIELIEGEPGGPWGTADGPHLDHLGFWAEDFEADKQRLPGTTGMPGGTGRGRAFGWGLGAARRWPHSGFRVELCGASGRAGFNERWKFTGSEDGTEQGAQ